MIPSSDLPARTQETTTVSPSVQQRDIWIVIAAYNEESRIGANLRCLAEAGWSNIVVVDDGSTDSTSRIAAQFSVWRLKHPVNCGKGAALKTGIEFALAKGARYIATLDADGQHKVDDLTAMVDPVVNGSADVTIGSRFLGTVVGIPCHRWVVLKLATIFTRLVSGITLTDPHNGFRAFSESAVRKIRLTQPRFAYASELIDEIVRLKLRVQEVPVTVLYTEGTLLKGQRSWGALKISTDLLVGRITQRSPK